MFGQREIATGDVSKTEVRTWVAASPEDAPDWLKNMLAATLSI